MKIIKNYRQQKMSLNDVLTDSMISKIISKLETVPNCIGCENDSIKLIIQFNRVDNYVEFITFSPQRAGPFQVLRYNINMNKIIRNNKYNDFIMSENDIIFLEKKLEKYS